MCATTIDLSEVDGLLVADAGLRKVGFWAVGSCNGNTAATANEYLAVCAADACLVQETRTIGPATKAAERVAMRVKLQIAINDAHPTDKGSTSAGVGVAVRTHIGLGADQDVQPPEEWRSRVVVRWMGGYARAASTSSQSTGGTLKG